MGESLAERLTRLSDELVLANQPANIETRNAAVRMLDAAAHIEDSEAHIASLEARLRVAEEQRDEAQKSLLCDPATAGQRAVATLKGLAKIWREDDVAAHGVLDWIGVAGGLSMSERVTLLAVEVATKQGYSRDEAERLANEAARKALATASGEGPSYDELVTGEGPKMTPEMLARAEQVKAKQRGASGEEEAGEPTRAWVDAQDHAGIITEDYATGAELPGVVLSAEDVAEFTKLVNDKHEASGRVYHAWRALLDRKGAA